MRTMSYVSSLSITVIKFLYFGAALTTHQYLFSKPSATGVAYSQSEPWMTASEAKPLVLVSIPAILTIDFVLPLAFIVLCWKVRDRFKHPSYGIYFGSLFDIYAPKCFWWELVTILKKVSVALVLKAFPPTDALQSAIIVSILTGTLALQGQPEPVAP